MKSNHIKLHQYENNFHVLHLSWEFAITPHHYLGTVEHIIWRAHHWFMSPFHAHHAIAHQYKYVHKLSA